MSVKLSNRKNEFCVFLAHKVNETNYRIDVPYIESFSPNYLYYTSDMQLTGKVKNDSEIKEDQHMKNGNTLYSLLLSYTHFLTQCVDANTLRSFKSSKPSTRPTLVYIGFNAGDHIAFMMEMFPMFRYIFVSDATSHRTTCNVMNAFEDVQGTNSTLGYYLKHRKVEHKHNFFGQDIPLEYRFVSVEEFLREIHEKSPSISTAAKLKLYITSQITLSADVPRLSNYPCSLNALTLKEAMQGDLYFISNYRSGDHRAKSSDNSSVVTDLIDLLYWLRVLNPVYSMVRYKPPLNTKTGIGQADLKKLLAMTMDNSGNISAFVDYPIGYMLRIPKNTKALDSCFMITGREMSENYTKMQRIYNENLRTLINYQNRYVRQVVLYEDIFCRINGVNSVKLPYSNLVQELVEKILTTSNISNQVSISNMQRDLFYLSSNWDDTVSCYIIMNYFKLFDHKISANRVYKTIIHSLFLLNYESESYSTAINQILEPPKL